MAIQEITLQASRVANVTFNTPPSLSLSDTGFPGPTTVRSSNIWLGAIRFQEKAAAFNTCVFSTGTTTTTTTGPPGLGDPPFPPVYPRPFSSDILYGRDFVTSNRKMFRGDTYAFDFTVLNYDGTALDLTGATLRFTAKWDIRDADNAAVIVKTSSTPGQIDITSPSDGEGTVTIVPSDTTSLASDEIVLFYDLQVYFSAARNYTVMYGKLRIIPDSSVTAP